MLNYYDFISSTSSDKKKSDPLVCKMLYRPPSFLIGWVLYLFGFSANQTSFLATLVALFSLPFLASTLSSYFIIGVLMLFFVSILDCADGNIARASKTSSQVGNFFDALTGYVVYAFVPLSLSMHVFISAEGVFSFIHFFGIIAGVIAAITNILARLIYHNWINSYVSTSNLDHVKNKPNYFSRISLWER